MLAELARSREVAFPAGSTVMSGTPSLSALVDGLASAVPIALAMEHSLIAHDDMTLTET